MESEIEEQLLLLNECQNKTDQKALETRVRQLLINLPHPNPRLQTQFRNAVIQSNARINAQFMDQKEQLLRNRSRQTRTTPIASSTLNASKKITQDLRYAVEMTDNQVNQSHAAIASLDQSSRTLAKTGDTYDHINASLDTSRKITSRMSRKDERDRMVLFGGIAIFLLTVLYLVWKRMWIPFL